MPSFFIEFGPKIKQNNQPGLQSIARIVACAGTLIIVHIVFRSSTQNVVLVQGRRIREKRGPADDGQAQISGQRFRRAKAKNFTWTQNACSTFLVAESGAKDSDANIFFSHGRL